MPSDLIHRRGDDYNEAMRTSGESQRDAAAIGATVEPAASLPARGAVEAGCAPESTGGLCAVYTPWQRIGFAVAAVAVAVVIAGFWNFRLADGFGRDVVAARTVGDPSQLAATFEQRGFGFGFLFAAVAGLAATFTACNCVVFAMLPGLACGGSAGRATSRRQALNALGAFTAGVICVSALYGMFVGMLGPEGIELYNARPIRSAQARTVFTAIGLFMLAWGALEMGLLEPLKRRFSPAARTFFAEPTTKAGLMGLLVGLFAVGRPFPVMRDFLTYAAAADSPLYGAAVMVLQGLGQIALMVGLFALLVYGFSSRLTRWATTRPHQVALTSAVALLLGGAFFVFYWGLANAFDIGRWGFRLGWYA